jgi:hypothetical protein
MIWEHVKFECFSGKEDSYGEDGDTWRRFGDVGL